LIDRIRASAEKDRFTLGLVDKRTPPPSFNQMMKSMIADPSFRRMATKMTSKLVVGMATGGQQQQQQQLLGGAAARAQIGGGPGPSSDPSTQQLATTQQQQQQAIEQLEAQVEAQVGAMLESKEFGGLVDKVVDSPGVQRIVRQAEDGTLCAGAESEAEVARCLLSGDLLKSVADATCEAAGVSAAECREVHAMTQTMLARLGLHGDGWIGWLLRRWMLQPAWMSVLLDLGVALLVMVGVGTCARRVSRSQSEDSE